MERTRKREHIHAGSNNKNVRIFRGRDGTNVRRKEEKSVRE